MAFGLSLPPDLCPALQGPVNTKTRPSRLQTIKETLVRVWQLVFVMLYIIIWQFVRGFAPTVWACKSTENNLYMVYICFCFLIYMYSYDSLIRAPIIWKSRLIRTESAGTNFRYWIDGRFSNPENSLIRKYRLGTNVSGLTNHHCTYKEYVTVKHLLFAWPYFREVISKDLFTRFYFRNSSYLLL